MSVPSLDTQKSGRPRARIPGRNGGVLSPFRPGEGQRTGYQKPLAYSQTLALARKHSPAAMQCLIAHLGDVDGRVAVTAANLILERAFGRCKEMRDEPTVQPRIDASKLTTEELRVLLALVRSDRFVSAEAPVEESSAPVVIEATNGK
jgi:hypothetical protein